MLALLLWVGKVTKMAAENKAKANRDLGGFTEECLAALKLIISFGNEDLAMETYLEKALVSKDSGFKANRMVGVLWGFFRTFIFGFFCYEFYMATIFVQNRVINPTTGAVYTIVEIIAVPQSLIMAIM